MYSRKSSAVARSSRVYFSEPRVRQRRFPNRKRSVMRPTIAPSTGANKKQTTLTQIDFIPHDESDEDLDLDASEDGEAMRMNEPMRKKRRISRNLFKTESQKTLTQIKFVRSSSTEVEDEEDDQEHENERHDVAHVNKDYDDVEEPWHHSFHEDVNATIKHDPSAMAKPELHTPPPTGAAEDNNDQEGERSSIKQSPQTQRLPPDETPRQRQPLREPIPSSQSPAATPLTLPFDSPSMRLQRTPLQELPLNVVAQRDESPSRKPPPSSKGKSPQRRRKAPQPSSNTTDNNSKHPASRTREDQDSDNEHSDQENHHPAFDLSKPTTSVLLPPPLPPPQPRIRSSQASTVIPASQQSHTTSTPSPTPQSSSFFFSTPPEHVPTAPEESILVGEDRNDGYSPSPAPPRHLQEDNAEEEWCSPVGTIHNSDEIVTVSQLVSASLLER